MKKTDTTVAVLRIDDLPTMSPRRARQIASWLGRKANAMRLAAERAKFAKRFTARFIATVALLFLVSCATPPRVSTATERATATRTLSTIEATLAILTAAGKVKPADAQLATAQINDLRALVLQSEFQPIDWTDVTLRLATLYAAWIVPGSPPPTGPPATTPTPAPAPAPAPVPMAEPVPAKAPPAPAAKMNPGPLIDALSARLESAPQRFAALSTPTPSGPEMFTSGQLRMVVTGHLGSQACDDGCFVVWCGPTTQVVSVSSTDGDVGYAFNVPGPNNSDMIGVHPTLPQTVTPGDALYVVSGPGGAVSTRPQLGFATGVSPKVDEASGIVFVGFDCRTDSIGALLHGPIWGGRGPLVDFLRNYPFPIDWINWSVLPSVFLDGPKPTLSTCYDEHRWYSGDVFSEWAPHIHGVPTTAHQQYGTYVAGQVGQALLLCCDESIPVGDRRKLVLALMQRGIEDLGGLCDASWRYALGGHCWGRVGTLVLLGHMYGIDAFGDPTPIVGQRLPEHQLSAVTSWWGQPNFTGYIYSHTFAQNLWASSPDTWGNADVQGTVAWCQRYGGQVVPALSATAAFVRIVGRERWAEQLVNLVRCWYAAPESVRAALAGQRIFVSIGLPEDYAMTVGFGAKAWARHGV